MATTKLKHTKDGKAYYQIRISQGHGKTSLNTVWYVPDGWSARSIERGLKKACMDFESECKAGNVMTRKQKRDMEETQRLEAEKIHTLRQYSEKVFLPRLKVTCSENTRYNFMGILKNHIYPAMGDFKLNEITPAQITAFLLKLQEGGLKIASVIKQYTILHLIFKQAYLEDAIEKNPMDRVQRPKPTKAEGKGTEMKAYTGGELAHIIHCLEKEPLKWRCYVRLLIDTGCRRGEALAIRWENVNFDDGSIEIANTLNYNNEAGVYLDTPKSGKKRVVYIGQEVIDLLKEMNKYRIIPIESLDEEQEESGDMLDVSKINDFVFTQDGTTSPMHPTSPTRYFKSFEKRYGVPDFHPHKLRHSFASVAITNGADIASVSECLGHADKATTLRMYTHADQESKKHTAEIFRNALTQPNAG